MPAPVVSNRLNIFISYSRADEAFAEDLRIGLEDRGYTVEIDKHSIRRGTDWKERLGVLIAACDTVVFIVSPNSARSEICHWEATHAETIGKRIIPVLYRGLHEPPHPREDGTPWPDGRVEAPPQLARLNYVRFDERRSFPLGLRELTQALEEDVAWIDAHSRLATRARDWDAGGRPDNRLMSGTEIAAAKRLIETRKASAPTMLPVQLDFIQASEHAEEARQRADELRAKQLRDAELAAANAKAETAEAEVRSALRQRRVALFGAAVSFAFALMAAGTTWWAWQKTWEARVLADEAVEQQNLTEQQRARAERQKERAEREAKAAQEAVKVVNILFDQVTGEASVSSSRETRDKDIFEKLSREAEGGNVTAKVNLGLLYWLGQGTAKNPDLAKKNWEDAAAANNAGGMTGLGIYYLADESAAKDEAKAREWLEKAAKAGDPTAMYFLAGLYRTGSGIANETKAREWFEKAAENGQIDAMYDLALMYQDLYDRGIEKDLSKALHWLEVAAARGSRRSMHAIGDFYSLDHGALGNHLKALEWYERAVAAGDLSALDNISRSALFVRQPDKALAAADRALQVEAARAPIEAYRAHALMYLNRAPEALAAYVANKGKPPPQDGDRTWEQLVADDFAELRKAGLDHPQMAEIEAALGIARK